MNHERERDERRLQLLEFLRDLSVLQECEAYKRLMEHVTQAEQNAYQKMTASHDPQEVMRLNGALYAYNQVRLWAGRGAEVAKHELRALST